MQQQRVDHTHVYLCGECDEKFKHRSALLRHEREVHPVAVRKQADGQYRTARLVAMYNCVLSLCMML